MARAQAPLLRITGDDFGKSEAVNEAIADCAERGVLTHASLMVRAPAFDDAVKRARSLPGLSVGLHLVLCQGSPAADPYAVPDLLASDGRFPDDSTVAGLRLWRHRHRLGSQLEREIEAQLALFHSSGLALAHVDGHHHIHQHPVVFGALRGALERHAVPRVRLVHEDRVGRHRPVAAGREVIVAIHGALARWHRRRARRERVRGAHALHAILDDERVYGLRASGRVDEDWLLWLIPRLCAPRVEIYCHPGGPPNGARERDALCSPRVREAIAAAGLRLARRGVR